MNPPTSTPKGAQQKGTDSKSRKGGKSPPTRRTSQLAAHQSSGIAKTSSKRQQSVTNTPKSGIPLPPQSSGGSTRKRVALAAQKKLFDPATTSTPRNSQSNPSATPRNTSVSKKLILSTPLDANNTKTQQPTSSLQPKSLAATANQHTMRTATPPVTVAEAQELGEQARLRDEVMWALEGLVSSKGPSQQESFATILELLANRRNRMALHASGIIQDVLKGIGGLDASCKDDVVIALGCSIILLMLSQVGADAKIFARNDFARLTTVLLQNTDVVSQSTAAASQPATRILRLLHEPPLSRFLPREASTSPIAVTLAALSNALDPHVSAVEAEAIKHAVRMSGALGAVAQIAADQNRSIDDPKPTMETVQSLWKLEKALVILEHACFACAENESHLVHLHVMQGTPPIIAKMPFSQWLVQQVHALSKQELVLGLKKDCLRSLLAVLMNITQNNQEGCALVLSVGGAQMVSSALAKIATGSAHAQGALHSKEELASWVDELSSCLGLLINLAEDSQECRKKLRALSLTTTAATTTTTGASSSSSSSPPGSIRLIPLLSQLITTTMGTSPHPAGSVPTSQQQQQHGGSDEVTLDSLRHGEGEAIGSIVEVYAAILLGFMCEGDVEAQKEASNLLPGKSLLPVVVAVRNCLHFYVNAGALTQRTETSLRALLASLEPTVEGK